MNRVRQLACERLTAEAFAAFGEVIEHAGSEPRRYLSTPFEAAGEARQAQLWVTRASPSLLPLRITTLERHQFAAQTFVPLGAVRFLVVVAPSASHEGAPPDLAGLRAFIAGPSQGISYRMGTWHHGLTVLDRRADFVVVMRRRGDNLDDQFFPLPSPIEILTHGNT
jgi:ureidoglycolate lyase